MPRFCRALFIALVVPGLVSGLVPGVANVVSAQVSPGIVSATGSASIERPAERMRMQIVIQGRDATPEGALKVLNQRIDKARKSLAKLEADKNSIRVGAPRIVEPSQNMMQNQMMIMGGVAVGAAGLGAGAAAGGEVAQPIIFSATLTADWILAAEEPGAMLAAVHQLQQKIKAVELSGVDEEAGLPDQGAAPPEGVLFQQVMISTGMPDLRQPAFCFVAEVAEQEYERAVAEAYERARRQAARLAKAAGLQLGDIRSLSSAIVSNPEVNQTLTFPMQAGQENPRNLLLMQALQQQGPRDDVQEALGVQPGIIKLRVDVTTSFDIKPR
jgi:uncharacterized protein YggE